MKNNIKIITTLAVGLVVGVAVERLKNKKVKQKSSSLKFNVQGNTVEIREDGIYLPGDIKVV